MKKIDLQNQKTRLIFIGIPLLYWLFSVIYCQFITNNISNYLVLSSAILLVITYIIIIISDGKYREKRIREEENTIHKSHL